MGEPVTPFQNERDAMLYRFRVVQKFATHRSTRLHGELGIALPGGSACTWLANVQSASRRCNSSTRPRLQRA
eukprot:6208165-Pleurochrysis_carterae.AAC.1